MGKKSGKRKKKSGERKKKITHQNNKNEQQNPFYLNALILYDDNDDHMGVRVHARSLANVNVHFSVSVLVSCCYEVFRQGLIFQMNTRTDS